MISPPLSLSLSPLPPSPPSLPPMTSSVAPSLPGLPFWDCEGEQCRGLHEKELSRDARLHEALQPAHHPRRRTYVKVRHKYICSQNVPHLQPCNPNLNNPVIYVICGCLYSASFYMHTVHNNSIYWQQETCSWCQTFIHRQWIMKQLQLCIVCITSCTPSNQIWIWYIN